MNKFFTQRRLQIATWILAGLVVLGVAFIFGWEVFYGYVIPQTNNLAGYSTVGLFSFAAFAGFMVNFGPCSITILPGYMSYYISLDSGKEKPIREGAKLGGIASIGVISFYLVLGILFAALGTYLSAYSIYMKLIVAVIILVLGIYMLVGGEISVGVLEQIKTYFNKKTKDKSKHWNLFGFGVIYGAGGLSCFLPVFLPLVFFPFISGKFFESIVSFIIFAAMQALFLIGATIAIAYGKKKVFMKLAKHSETMKKFAGVILIITAFLLGGLYIYI